MVFSEEICDKLTDDEVVRKSIGDLNYFTCLYLRYETKLLNYIRRIAFLSDEEAEDILQDSFIKAWRNLRGYDQGLKFSSWLYRIAHNETISFWRSKKSHGKDNRVDFDDHVFNSLSFETSFDMDVPQHDKIIREVLEQMPVKYRDVLVLKYFESMSYEDISDILKIPEGTVATRINRAKKSFATLARTKNISFE